MARWTVVVRACAVALACSVPAGAQSPGAEQAPQAPPAERPPPAVAPIAPAPADDAARAGAKVWLGREDEFSEYLKTAGIDKIEQVPIGVTKPRRALFAPGGIAGRAVVKALPTAVRSGFWESYKHEIAAYEMDRLLHLDMVPVTVERRVDHDLASVQLWVESCHMLNSVDQSKATSPSEWAKQALRQRVFDNLIANIDRNQGNILVDDAWNMILIDHSRAFSQNRMPFEKQMTRLDREFFERLKALDEQQLMQKVRPWLMSDRQIREMLGRRDKIVKQLETLARERGEQAVFPF
jgi:hypothetical protein